MLPRAARVHTAADFATISRRGSRFAARTQVVHLLLDGTVPLRRAGFVVSKKVGNSVVRHRVVRRLRAVVGSRLTSLPEGAQLVVRALPEAADASSAELGTDFDLALAGALRRTRGGARR